MKIIFKVMALLMIAAAAAPIGAMAADDAALREQLKSASTPAERKAVMERIRQSRGHGAAAARTPETPADAAARKGKVEQRLKNDPDRLQEYRLRETLHNAKTEGERDAIRKQMDALRAKRAAAAEAALTPAQKAARAERAAKMEAMRAETRPLMESLHSAKTDAERSSIRAAISEIRKKYNKHP